MTSNVLLTLDARDRALLSRLAVRETTSHIVLRLWIAITHIGGVASSLLLAALPVAVADLPDRIAADASGTLLLSHVVVQLVKRAVGRPRPSARTSGIARLGEPDRFSFPSGHSTAAMSIAFAYATAFPALAAPLLLVAMAVGLSRVALGVHYPGDVVAGQLIAILTGLFVFGS